MAQTKAKFALLGASTIAIVSLVRKLKELKRRKRKLIKSKEKLRRKAKADRPVKLQKSTLELYDSDSEAQRAKRPRLEEEEEKSDDDSVESIVSTTDSDSSNESCYSSLISNSESDSTHSESFITDSEEERDFVDDDDTADDDYDLSSSGVKSEPLFDPLSTVNYDDEDVKPDLDELTEALKNANNDNSNPEFVSTSENRSRRSETHSSNVRIKEEPRFF